MLSNVFLKTLRDMRGAILGFGLGLGLYGLFIMSFVNSFVGRSELQSLFETAPEALLALYGEFADFNTVEGYLGSSIINFAPLILSIFSIGQGLGFTSGEEDKKTIDLLLANPLPRWRVLAEKIASFLIATLLIWFLIVAGVLTGGIIFAVELDYERVLPAFANILPITVMIASFATMAAAFFPSRRLALSLSTFLIVGSYLFDYLARVVEDLEPYRPLSIFYYFGGGRVFAQGLSGQDVGILLGLAFIFFVAALWAFDRRDLRV